MSGVGWPEVARRCLRAAAAGQPPDPAELKTAVREALAELARRAPGHSVEVRVPPYGAVQVLEGVRHRRGTPPAVVELTPLIWLGLALGDIDWVTESAAGRVRASGERSDLSEWLPLA